MGNRQNTTASQGSSLGVELEQTERTRAWLAEIGFVDDQAVSQAIEHCGTDHKKVWLLRAATTPNLNRGRVVVCAVLDG